MSWYVRILITMLSLVGTGVMVIATPAQADDGNILPPFDQGQQWWVCQGYNGPVSHTGTSQYGLDLTGGPNCDNSASGRTVRAPMSGTVYYYQAAYGNLCVNVAGGRSYTLTHINSSVTGGSVTAGQSVGTVGSPGTYGNAGVAHIHFQMWSTANCYSSSGIPFDSAHSTRICGAPDLTANGPNNGNGTWSGQSFLGAACTSSTPPPPPTNGHVYYMNNAWDSQHDFTTSYGNDGTQTLVGDWNGNGVDTLAMRVGNTFYMNDDFDGQHNMVTTYGNPGADIYVGDWDGDGVDTLAMRVGNVFYVNNAWDMQHDFTVAFGNPGAEIVVGDWNGDGIDTFGMRSGNTFYMNNNFDGSHDFVTSYGDPGQKVVVGDWNGNGVDTLGVRVGNTFYMNDDWDGQHNMVTSYGNAANQILVGDWNGDGVPTLAMRDLVQP